MHARARLAPIASENIPQMVHPTRGEEEIGASPVRVCVYTRMYIRPGVLHYARSVMYEVSRIEHVSRHLDSARINWRKWSFHRGSLEFTRVQ